VSVAEGRAYALVAGVYPVYGFYAGSVTVLVGSLLTSSTLLVITATNALALVTAMLDELQLHLAPVLRRY
jgi:SulP family sulfate permease